jgi:hypothetical protein
MQNAGGATVCRGGGGPGEEPWDSPWMNPEVDNLHPYASLGNLLKVAAADAHDQWGGSYEKSTSETIMHALQGSRFFYTGGITDPPPTSPDPCLGARCSPRVPPVPTSLSTWVRI